MNKKIISLVLLLAMIACVFTGCGNKQETPASEVNKSEETQTETKKETTVKDKIVYGAVIAPRGTFNPLLAYMGSDGVIDSVTYASLLRTAGDGSLQPYLAESYEVSEDQKVITFKLKENAKWQDGEPVTAEDVAFTFNTMGHKDFTGGDFEKVEKLVGAHEYYEGKVDSIKGIQVIDDYTVTLEFSEVYAPALNKLGTCGIVAKHIWSEIPIDKWDDQTEMLNYPIGCGPYKVVKYEPGQYVEMEAFEDFFAGAPKTKKLIYKVINDDAIAAELKSGNIDLVGVKNLKTSEIDSLKDLGLKLVSMPDNMYQYVGINMRMPIFRDKNLRQAFNYAVDRELIVEKLVEGRGATLDVPFLPSGWAYPPEGTLNTYKYDPEKAKSLLEESGWIDRDGDGIRENEAGEKLQFTMKCSNDSKIREQAVLVIQESWKEVGIDIEVSVEEDAKMANDCIFDHDFELYALNCYFGSDPDPYGWWHSDSATDEKGVGSFNFGSYKNDKVDECIEKANATLDQEERKAYYLEVAKQINEDAPMMFLYVQDKEVMHNPNLKGYEPSTFNEFYNVHNWVIEE
ncbi:peptide-binding protein [Clostridium sp. Cult2]|uniref:peptide-binding protein n=1 Tax=Clostridium sp. Cult2 TaxID=2079003 RepID=UPI001F20017E|nr:peptide-binding protein [Clostridium sp. Cult2]MCF6466558.1 hypothetical protein [Clostridium sp. Cult2]